MFGVFRLQLPTGWQTRFAGWSKRLPGGRVGPVFVMGMLSALIVGPCSTPALAGALLYIANSRDISGGALALYLMGIGIGIPLLLVGTFGTRLLPKSGHWMVAVQNTLGVMLLAAALWFVYSLLPAWLLMSLIALLLTACGRCCGRSTRYRRMLRASRESAKRSVCCCWSLVLPSLLASHRATSTF
ncbi:Thiol:disulfide interchange protein DsbD [Burkholderia multivorans]|uniref:cytochrome c biogenesis protein CcdA n=1 Tax=Burkholderia multivorans TaxID=87883 RepID=UPI002855AC13|nr:cytochrome c biogenesis protein CcdA [Burkholderia multivorans]MDR9265161.1 Thiol:disulfide interchange protein DsbD [Burkholderia multivorans]